MLYTKNTIDTDVSPTDEKKVIKVIKKCTPSVVSIVISKHIATAGVSVLDGLLSPQANPFASEHPEQPEEMSGMPAPDKNGEVKIGGGSGFFITNNGLILTNKHVVIDGSASYTAITSDSKQHPAEVVSVDHLNDIAILKIKSAKTPALKIGDSSKIELGQSVITIGNPLGMFQNTVSRGIVSGLNRKISAALDESQVEELRGMIQTDAAINQGNSGGPLINMGGEVIGINTAIIYGAQNMGFAIPINSAKRDIESILKHGKIIQPYLGVRFITLNTDIQNQYKLPTDYGALVVKGHLPTDQAVIENSPADKAGIQENDIILTFGRHKVNAESPITEILQNCKIGDEIELTLLRKGEKIKTKLTLEERK